MWENPLFLPSYNIPSTLFGGVAKVVKGTRVSAVDNQQFHLHGLTCLGRNVQGIVTTFLGGRGGEKRV